MIKRESAVEGRRVHPGESLAAPRPAVASAAAARPTSEVPVPKPEPEVETDPRTQLNVKIRSSLKTRLKAAQRKMSAEKDRDVLLHELIEEALDAYLSKQDL